MQDPERQAGRDTCGGDEREIADRAAIDRDLFANPAVEIKDAKVLLTVVGGRLVFAAAPFVRE
jgi:hypothetical protein